MQDYREDRLSSFEEAFLLCLEINIGRKIVPFDEDAQETA
jgi:hypothetical protein